MKKVLLIYGGISSEHEISCLSAESIIKNIDLNKYQLECVKISKDNNWYNYEGKIKNIIEYIKNFDVVFPITHGTYGEDGKLQGLLDSFKIKYVGSKCGPSFICMDKQRTKEVLNNYDIPQIPFEIYKKRKKINLQFPVIVKPSNGGSSIGIQIANNTKQLKKAIKLASKYDKKIMIEKYINAKELECAVLESSHLIVSDIGEIIPTNDFYDYDSKYNTKSKTIIPADISVELKNQIREYSKLIFKILDLNSLARIDFLYDKDLKKLYFNEVNTLPGFTEISMFPQLMIKNRISYKELISKLIENAK